MLFTPTIRDRAIETTISNLIMAGLLERKEVPKYMACIAKYTDTELGEVLVESRLLLDGYYERTCRVRRN